MRCPAEHDPYQCWLNTGHPGEHVGYGDPNNPAIRWPNPHRLMDRLRKRKR